MVIFATILLWITETDTKIDANTTAMISVLLLLVIHTHWRRGLV
jgi:hypothetical protein